MHPTAVSVCARGFRQPPDNEHKNSERLETKPSVQHHKRFDFSSNNLPKAAQTSLQKLMVVAKVGNVCRTTLAQNGHDNDHRNSERLQTKAISVSPLLCRMAIT